MLNVSAGCRRNLFLISLSAGTAFAALSGGAALAQPGPVTDEGEDAGEVETLVVIGARVPVPAKELGSTLTVIGQDDILQRQQPLVADLLRDVPGLAVSQSGPRGTLTQVRIRGAEANQTLVFIDGQEANDPFGNEFNFGNLLTFDLERIEVLRGPQSALYGSEAIGGVVSIATVTPEPGLAMEGLFEGGSFGTVRTGGAIGGGTEDFRARGSIVYLDTDGISISPIGSEEDAYDNLSANFKAVATPLKNLTLTSQVRYTSAEVDGDTQDFTFGSPTQGLVVDADQATRSDRLYVGGTADLALLDGAFQQTLRIGYTDADTEFVNAGTVTAGNLGERLEIIYQATATAQTGAFGHRGTFAVEYEDLEFENRGAGPADPSSQIQSDEQLSFIGEYALDWADTAFLTGSIRHDANDLFDDATTWRVTGAYLLGHTNSRLHASAGTGITNPTFFELFGFIPDTFLGNPDLQPEESFGFDIGVEQRFLSGALVLDVTYFQADLQDEIQTDFFLDEATGLFFSTPINGAGDSERQGVEITANARITEQLTVDAAYTYLDAEGPDGLAEVRRAENIASANVNYSFARGRANLNLGVDYNGAQEDSEFIFATPETRVTLDSYTLVNLAASYRVVEGMELFVRIENLTDADYEDVFGFATAGAGAFGGVRIALGG